MAVDAGSVIGSAFVKIAPDTSGFASDLQSGVGSAISSVSKGFLALGAAVVGVTALSIDLAAKYNTSLSQIQANTGITAKAATAIGQAFLSTAGQTTFSAGAIAAAFAPVSGLLDTVNGSALTAGQSLAFMDQAMDLAEASGTSLSSATSDLAKTLQAFQLPVSQAALVTNVLFNAAKDGGVGVDSLAQSLDRARAQMGAAAPPIQVLGGLLLDLTNHGETGRQAMSTLGSAFTGIISPTAAVTKAQDALGLSFKTANGSLKPVTTIFAELQPVLAGLSPTMAAATLKTLGFGSASAKLAETIQAGPAVLQSYIDMVDKTGSAHTAAETATDNFTGAFDKLKAGVEDAATSFGESLMPALTTAMNWIRTNGIPDLEKFGSWVGTYIVTPFMNIASVVIPPLITALGWVFSNLDAIKLPALTLAGILLTMWTVDKIAGWVSAAQAAIRGVLAIAAGGSIGGGAAGGAGAAGAAGATGATTGALGAGGVGAGAVTGTLIPISAGVALLASNITQVITAMTPLIKEVSGNLADLAGGTAKMAAQFGITATQAQTFASFMGPLNSAMMEDEEQSVKSSGIANESAANKALYMAALANAIKQGVVTNQASLNAFNASWSKSITAGDGIAVQMGKIAVSSAAANSLIGTTYTGIGDKMILWESALESAGVSGSLASAAQADLTKFIQLHGPATANEMQLFQNAVTTTGMSAATLNTVMATVSAFVAKNGPLTTTQMLAIENDLTHGATSAFDINLSLASINAQMVPAISYAQAWKNALALGAKNAAAAAAIARGLSGGGGYTAAEGGVANAPSSGQLWMLHGQEAIVPKSKAGWLWEPMLDAIAHGTPSPLRSSIPAVPVGIASAPITNGAGSSGAVTINQNFPHSTNATDLQRLVATENRKLVLAFRAGRR